MSGLVAVEEIYFWLSLMCWMEIGGGGGKLVSDHSRGMVWKFFNRSPITLKFEAEKLERESQARERESESELSFYICL
jgi:hypothetical protein